MAGPRLAVQAAVETKGVTEGVRAAGPPFAELTSRVRAYSQETKRAVGVGDELAGSNKRQGAAAQALLRLYQQQTRDLISLARAARLGVQEFNQLTAAQTAAKRAGGGPVASVDAGMAQRIAAQIHLQQELQAVIMETLRVREQADRFAGNLQGLQERTRLLREEVAAMREGAQAAREFAEAQQVRRQISQTGAAPGSNDAEMVEREVRAQQRLEAELREVAAARERDAAAAREGAAARARVSDEISQLRETTTQLGVLAAAHHRGSAAVREANIQLEVRNTLLRLGVREGTAEAAVIQRQISLQHQYRQEIDQITAAKQRATTGVFNLRNAFFALQGVLATLGLSALVRDAIGVALALERAEKSLIGATGSAAAAKREMAFVRAESERLGLVLTDTSTAYGRIAAAAKGTVLEGQAVRDIFSAVSETATVLGLNAEQTSGALLAVQQMMAKGRVTAEELVQQLSERLPNAYQAMATSLGISTQELAKRLEQGKVGLKDLIGWAEALRKSVAVGLPNAVGTFQARLNRLTNDINDLKAALGRGFLEGFLAGFQDLHGALTDEELRIAARNLGESIGKALRTAADAAAFLAKNLELVKAALIAILALKAAAWFVGLTSAIAGATGATITFKAVSSNLALAGGLGAVGIALLAVIVVMQKYITTTQLAYEAEMAKVEKSQEIFGYYETLKANKVGLTEAEAAYAIEVRKTMEAERAALAVSLARSRAQLLASQTLNPFKYLKSGPGRNALREQVAEQERELQTLGNQLNILNHEWLRLAKLPTIKLPIDDTGLDKTAKKIADLLEGFRRAAEQAERMAAAQKRGAGEAFRVSQAIERENAAYGALHSIEGLSADAKRKLTEIIGVYVGRQQEATASIEETTSARERDLEFTDAAREAEARLADAISQTTANSRDIAAQLEAEAIARSKNLDAINDPEGYAKEVALQLQAIRVRKDYIAGVELEVEWIQKSHEAAVAQRQAEAELADAKDQSTDATQRLAVVLEAETEARTRGIQQGTIWYQLLLAIIATRRQELATTQAQTAAQQRLNEARRREAGAQADLADFQQQAAAARRYGEEIAGILGQYGLLSAATKELAIQEEILAAIQGEKLSRTNAAHADRIRQIEEEIRAEHAVLDQIDRYRAEMALVAHVNEPIDEAWRQTGQTIKDVLADVIMGAEVNWKDLLKSMLAMWVRAMIEMVARWIAAQRIMAATSVASGGYGGGAGWQGIAFSAAGQAMGGGGGMGMGGMGGGGMMAGAGRAMMGNPMTSGGYGAYGTALWGAVVVAAMAAIVNWVKTLGTPDGKSVLGVEDGRVTSTRSGKYVGQSANAQRHAEELGAAIAAVMNQIMEALGGAIDSISSDLVIGRHGQGKKAYYYIKFKDAAGNWVEQRFKDMDEAMAAGVIQALKTAETSGLSPEVEAAIHSTVATTLEQLQKDIDTALAAVRARLGETGSQVYDTYRKYDDEIAAARALGIATEALVEQRDREVESIKNQLLGISTSTADFLRELGSFQRGIEEAGLSARGALERQIREAQAQIDDLLATGPRTSEAGPSGRSFTQSQEAWNQEIERLRAQVERYLAELDKIPQGLSDAEINMGIFDALYRYLEGSGKYAAQAHKYAQLKVELEFAAIKAQLIALGKWEEFAEMFNDAYAAASAAAGRGGRVGGGGQRQQDRDTLTGLFDDHDRQMARQSMSEYAAAVADINQKWDEAIPLAHGNAKELERIAKARREELDALRADARREHRAELRPLLEDYGKSGPQLALEDIRKKFDALKKSAKELGEPLWKVNLAQQRASKELGKQVVGGLGIPIRQTKAEMEQLGEAMDFLRNNAAELGLTTQDVGEITAQVGQQMFMGLVDGLLQFVDDEETRRQLEQMRYDLTIAQYQLQFEMLKDMGLLTQAQIDTVQALFDKLPEVVPSSGGGGGGYGGGGGGYHEPPSTDYWDKVFEAVNRVQELRRGVSSQDEFEVELAGLEDEFAKLRLVLAPFADQIAELDRAYAEVMADLERRKKERDDELLRPYEEADLDPLTRELLELEREFAHIRETMGDTARVQEAYAKAVQDVIARHLQPIKDFQKELALSEFSPLKGQQRLDVARGRFSDLAAEIAAGDLTHLDQVVGTGQDLLREALAALPQGSEAYRAMFAEVNGILSSILTKYGQEPDAAAAAPNGTAAQPININMGPLTGQLQASSDAQLVELREIKRNTGETRNEVYTLRRRFDQPITVFEAVS